MTQIASAVCAVIVNTTIFSIAFRKNSNEIIPKNINNDLSHFVEY